MRAALPFRWFYSAFVLFGCSSSSNDAKEPAVDAGDASSFDAGVDVAVEAAVEGSSDAPSAECQTLSENLAKALEEARVLTGSRDAALAVSKPGCSVAIVRGETSLSAEHLFRIGSITKTYTASVILRLVAQKEIALDDVAEKWVSGLPNGAAITVKQLLTHESGLYNYTSDSTFLANLKKAWAPDELIQISISHGADFAPGTQWAYSNTNYVVLGVIAEQVAQKPIDDQIRAELLTPLALEHTFLDGAEPLADSLAPGFFASGGDATLSIHPSAAWSAGAIAARIGDVDRWITALARGDVHDATTQAAMLTGVPTGLPTLEHGLGVMLLDGSITAGAGDGIGHNGHINGYDSQAFHFPATDVTVVSIVNQEGAKANDITLAALNVLFP